MELLLNVLWLLLASGAILAWLCQKRGSVPGRGRRWLQVVALGCALAVLFPAVSATDDLHAAQLAVEASDVARKVLRGMNTVSSSGAIDWLHFLPALLLVAMVVALRRRFFAALPERRATLLSVEFLSSSEGRAPPACSHA